MTEITEITEMTKTNTNNIRGIFDPEGINLNPLNNNSYSDSYKKLSKFWSNLPAYKMGEQVVESIKQNDVVLISSGTGSGKTVLVPKFALDANNYQGRIIVTLPKKIITKNAAEYAAKTLDIKLGEQVGYQFRGENAKSFNTILLYSTDGSIIAQIKSDPLLKHIDMVIIDEAHERKVQIDLLLYLLKNAITIRKEKNMKPLKLIIMSATINEKLFETYYKDFNFEYLFLSGKPNYPIESIYLESSLNIKTNQYVDEGMNTIINLVNKINNNDEKFIQGDMLFFVCSIRECEEIAEKLTIKLPDSFVMPLYSGFDPELEQYISDQYKYKELNSKYTRRIFVSTNVAESSLTIDGIVYVIDSGLELGVKFDPEKNINIMAKTLITQAQISQRKGRSGRTKPGFCFHLYTPNDEKNTGEFPEPEIRRIDIKDTCLSLLKLGSDINNGNFTVENAIKMFTDFIQPPYEKFITDGFDFSIQYNIIGQDMMLTNIGNLIVDSRLDIQDGLCLIYAWNINHLVFKAVFQIISICAYLKSGIDNLFNDYIDKSTKNKLLNKFAKDSNKSEHILLYLLYNHIQSNKSKEFFNLKLINEINYGYKNQIDKLVKIYDNYAIKIENINTNIDTNIHIHIIHSFNYGYKFNRAFRSGLNYKFNNIICDLSKSIIKFDKQSSIIFYLNRLYNGKLNIMICSPYLLK